MKNAGRHICAVILCLAIFCSNLSAEQGEKPKFRHKRSGNGNRFHVGTALNFYQINERHATAPKQLLHFTAGFRRELRVTKDYRGYFLFGADYLLHGLSFDSYYFRPGSLKIYDKQFNHQYSVYQNELHIPFQLKVLLRREDNSLFSPYLLFGYHFRYLLPASVRVKQKEDGRLVKDDIAEMRFRNHIIHEKVNASVSGSVGWQINNMSDYRGSFFAEINFQYGFSDYYSDPPYAPSSLFINCMHVSLLLGSKF